MKSHSKKSFKKEIGFPIATAKKHWVVYVFPVVLIALGIYLVKIDEILPKAVGGIMILGSVLRIIQIANTKWHLTKEHLFIESGIMFRKKYEQVPVFDLYKSSTSTNKIGRILNFGQLTAKRRSDHCTGLRHSIVSNHNQFHSHIDHLLQNSPAQELNKVYELKEKCVISENEYNIMKLGYITKQHLS